MAAQLSAEGAKQQQTKRRLSLRFRKYRKLHQAAKEALPSFKLAAHRFWIAVEKPTKVGGLSDPSKRYQWFKGNRLTCVETLRRLCGQLFYNDEIKLLLGDMRVSDEVQAQEMDFFSDKIVVLKAVPGAVGAAKITAGLTSTIVTKEDDSRRSTPSSSADAKNGSNSASTINDQNSPIILDDGPATDRQASPVFDQAKASRTTNAPVASDDVMIIEDD